MDAAIVSDEEAPSNVGQVCHLPVEQRDGEDSPLAAACDTFEEPPPVIAVVVVQHDVSAFEAALGDVMQSVGNVDAVGARHGPYPGCLCSADSVLWGRVPVLGSGVPISKLAGGAM